MFISRQAIVSLDIGNNIVIMTKKHDSNSNIPLRRPQRRSYYPLSPGEELLSTITRGGVIIHYHQGRSYYPLSPGEELLSTITWGGVSIHYHPGRSYYPLSPGEELLSTITRGGVIIHYHLGQLYRATIKKQSRILIVSYGSST